MAKRKAGAGRARKAASSARKNARTAKKARKATASSTARRTRGAAARKPARPARKAAAQKQKKTAAGSRKTGRTAKAAQKTAGRRKAASRTIAKRPARQPASRAATGSPTADREEAIRPRRPAALDRERRILREEEGEPHGAPSSLQYGRASTGVDTGRAEMLEKRLQHHGTSASLTGGDVDADWEGAYFTGEEAPGGDNPTPDQDVVEEIGRSLGVEYQDTEELHEKVADRDRHRWELDPASSEDYRDRSKK